MARAPKAPPPPPGGTRITLEQFAAIEGWMEAYLRYALKPQHENHAPLITDVYRKRQRAMFLLTGAMPPADDEDAFHKEVAAFVAEAKAGSGARLAPRPIKQPTNTGRKAAPAPDDDDPYDIG